MSILSNILKTDSAKYGNRTERRGSKHTRRHTQVPGMRMERDLHRTIPETDLKPYPVIKQEDRKVVRLQPKGNAFCNTCHLRPRQNGSSRCDKCARK